MLNIFTNEYQEVHTEMLTSPPSPAVCPSVICASILTWTFQQLWMTLTEKCNNKSKHYADLNPLLFAFTLIDTIIQITAMMLLLACIRNICTEYWTICTCFKQFIYVSYIWWKCTQLQTLPDIINTYTLNIDTTNGQHLTLTQPMVNT